MRSGEVSRCGVEEQGEAKCGKGWYCAAIGKAGKVWFGKALSGMV